MFNAARLLLQPFRLDNCTSPTLFFAKPNAGCQRRGKGYNSVRLTPHEGLDVLVQLLEGGLFKLADVLDNVFANGLLELLDAKFVNGGLLHVCLL